MAFFFISWSDCGQGSKVCFVVLFEFSLCVSHIRAEGEDLLSSHTPTCSLEHMRETPAGKAALLFFYVEVLSWVFHKFYTKWNNFTLQCLLYCWCADKWQKHTTSHQAPLVCFLLIRYWIFQYVLFQFLALIFICFTIHVDFGLKVFMEMQSSSVKELGCCCVTQLCILLNCCILAD